MKKISIFIMISSVLTLSSYGEKCGDYFAGKVWYLDKPGIKYSFQDKNSDHSGTIVIKVEKINDDFFVYYWDRTGVETVDKFKVTCDNNTLKGEYNGQNITMAIMENGNLLLNQYEIQSAGNRLKEWNRNKTKADEDAFYSDFEHSKFAGFLMWYDFFLTNTQTGEADYLLKTYRASMAKKYNTDNTGDIGIGKDKEINKKYHEDVIKKIEKNEY
jgi:hypothetical protein